MSRFRPVVSRRTPSESSFAEMFLAPGPQAIAQTGDNSYEALFGRDWLLVVDRDDGLLRLYQEQGGQWMEVVDDLPPVFGSPAPAGSRRWSLAFDQAARVILAYEDSEGIVRVTRWDPALNQYVQNVTFAGVDPVVVMDASWRYLVPDSDVLPFYLSPDRQRVLCRVQRDVYAVEHLIWDYGTPVILDRVIALPYRYQVLVADVDGSPLPDVLVSELYPVTVTSKVQLTTEVVDGHYEQIAFTHTPSLSVALDPELAAGALTLPVTIYAPTIGAELASEFVSGIFEQPITYYRPVLGVELAPELAMSALDEIGVPYTPPLGVELEAEVIGGTYEPG